MGLAQSAGGWRPAAHGHKDGSRRLSGGGRRLRCIGVVCAAAGLVLTLTTACRPTPELAAGDGHDHAATDGPVALDLYEFGGDFTLTGPEGRPFRLADQRGKVVLLFFGYASCPDVCPTTLATVSTAMKQLGGRSKGVLTVLVSVDPERDTPAVLSEYIGHFQVPATAVTGSKADLDRIVAQYKAHYEKVDSGSAMGYLIDHTAIVYVIDQRGRVRFLHRYGDGAARLAEAVRQLL